MFFLKISWVDEIILVVVDFGVRRPELHWRWKLRRRNHSDFRISYPWTALFRQVFYDVKMLKIGALRYWRSPDRCSFLMYVNDRVALFRLLKFRKNLRSSISLSFIKSLSLKYLSVNEKFHKWISYKLYIIWRNLKNFNLI